MKTHIINSENSLVFLHAELIIEGLVKVVNEDLGYVIGGDLDLDPGVLHEQLDVALRDEHEKHDQPVLLVGPELEGDFVAVGPLVPVKPNVGVLSPEA